MTITKDRAKQHIADLLQYVAEREVLRKACGVDLLGICQETSTSWGCSTRVALRQVEHFIDHDKTS